MAGFGRFIGEVRTEWIDPDRVMRLLRDFTYVDPEHHRWLAPADSLIDGASIPRPLWTLIGSPFTGRYRRASVVHDVACVVRTHPWRRVHRMFYSACRCGGVGEVKAKVMYAAVYRFGPRWEARVGLRPTFKPTQRGPAVERGVRSLRDQIEATNPSLEEIEGLNP
jgi:hypothetical protein